MVYTQEMKDNGELPVVGMKCLDSKGNEVVFLGEHKGEAWLESVSNTVDWHTHCDAVKNLKPLKTPEQIKLEEAKKKQVDDISKLLSRNGMSHDPIWIKCLQSHGHLAEITLPFKSEVKSRDITTSDIAEIVYDKIKDCGYREGGGLLSVIDIINKLGYLSIK